MGDGLDVVVVGVLVVVLVVVWEVKGRVVEGRFLAGVCAGRLKMSPMFLSISESTDRCMPGLEGLPMSWTSGGNDCALSVSVGTAEKEASNYLIFFSNIGNEEVSGLRNFGSRSIG